MKSASTSGYRGVYNGMTREEVEDKFGTSSSVESLKWSYETYGDWLAVGYDNEVVSVGVAPNHISEDQFLVCIMNRMIEIQANSFMIVTKIMTSLC